MAEEGKNTFQGLIDMASSMKEAFESLRGQIGELGAVVLFALAASVFAFLYVVTHGKEIKEWLFVERFIHWLRRKRLPKAPAYHLTIAVANLEDDKDLKQKKKLLPGLEDFDGVETLNIDRVVEWPATGTERENRKKAEEEARGLLKQIGVDVLIWGRVIERTMRLYWTPSREISGAKASGNYQPQSTETIALPEAFWSDLKQILGLLAQTRLAELTFDQEGHYVADRLAPLITQVGALADSKEGVWNPETLAGVRLNLAVALTTFGNQSGQNEPLAKSVELFRKVLGEWTRERDPLKWAKARTRLGFALACLGERESGTEKLQQAVEAYREVLKEFNRERVPLEWAAMQTNLSSALFRLGERESGTEKLQQAVEASREALKEFTRGRVPLQWAMTQTSLGNALLRLGERESGTEKLQQAVEAFREVLKERTRERVPLEWASTQTSLGIALLRLGERERGTKTIGKAVEAFREALKEYTRDRVPLDWAATQNNLGNAFVSLGDRERGTTTLGKAVEAFREVLKETTRERVPLDWATTQYNLASTLFRLGLRESGTGKLEEAVLAYREALKERTRDRVPLEWAQTQNNLGVALETL
ncbi:MAG: tetratricopeptide repeat protein, partial [Methylocella sp.]